MQLWNLVLLWQLHLAILSASSREYDPLVQQSLAPTRPPRVRHRRPVGGTYAVRSIRASQEIQESRCCPSAARCIFRLPARRSAYRIHQSQSSGRNVQTRALYHSPQETTASTTSQSHSDGRVPTRAASP